VRIVNSYFLNDFNGYKNILLLGIFPQSLLMKIELESVITCPICGHIEKETMPTAACQFFYECKGCGVILKPKPGDCCVFCSYGTVPCPSVQENKK
jgi:hypothetical protein